MVIHGYNQLTLLDFPGKVASTVFLGSCNFRCPFCHNASLVLHPGEQPTISEEAVFEHISKRKGTLEGICITGGEPTLCRSLPDFIRRLKAEGLAVKLDTNGSNPEMVRGLLADGLLDMIAMDIKSSPAGYAKATGLDSFDMGAIFDSAELLMNSGIRYEFRTTVVDGIHKDSDFIKIGEWLKGDSPYFLQRYKDSGDLIAPEGLSAPSYDTMKHYMDILLPYLPNTELRGVG